VRVLLVEWLGRGGIAQCTEAWGMELAERNHDVSIACPPGREISAFVLPLQLERGRIRRHRSLVQAVVRLMRTDPPDVVVLNNYVIPLLEASIASEARRRGIRLVSVIHNVIPHSAVSGWAVGLKYLLQDSDVLVVHSNFEKRRLVERMGLQATVIPHPVQIGMLGTTEWKHTAVADPPAVCQFGIMKRKYKGAGLMIELAEMDHQPWRLRVAGVGAPVHPLLETHSGFLPADDLVDFVSSSSVAVFPYRHATQSGGVVLAKALGVIPVATSVGALSEQITHGRSGFLMDASVATSDWLRALEPLQDEATRIQMGIQARREAWKAHHDSVEMIGQLMEN